MPDAKPYPKSAQLARGERRYRRRVASPKQWQAIIAAKRGPCRLARFGCAGTIEYHHIVPRDLHGDDVAENIAPVCSFHHDALTRRELVYAVEFAASLRDDEYAYAIEKGGEDVWERAYGIRYER